ncbi:MAG: cell division protein FtsQ/DivIB [Terracidiphilus sp.]
MTTLSSHRSRPFAWEETAPAESRVRRLEPGAPLPGMPLEMQDSDEEDPPGLGKVRGAAIRSHGNQVSHFRSQRWRPASRTGLFFFLFAVLIALGGLVVSGRLLKTVVERDASFRIAGAGNIEMTGLNQLSRDRLLPVFGADIGRNIFFVPLAERRRQLEQIPWIEQATVMRLLPDRIRVSVVERKPVAFVREGERIGLVDAHGVLLSMPTATMAQHHYSFPVLTGLDPRDTPASRQQRIAVYLRLMSELDSTGQKLSEQISEIDLTDPEDAQVLMPEPGGDVLVHFGQSDFLQRYQRYAAHIARWRQQYPNLVAVDLRYPQQVVLEMAPGTDVAAAAASRQSADHAAAAQNPPLAGTKQHQGVAAVNGKPAAKDKLGSRSKTRERSPARRTTARARVFMRERELAQARARQRRRAAAARRAALNLTGRKTPPTVSPALSAGEAQSSR